MGRRTQVTRTAILQAGLELVQNEGAQAVQIKRLAAKLGCSTQPIAWHFGSMEAYRKALFCYAVEQVRAQMAPVGDCALQDFGRVGWTYVDIAVQTPRLIQYLRSDPAALVEAGGIGLLYCPNERRALTERLACEMKLSQQQAENFLLYMIVHTEGIVSLVISDLLKVDKSQAHAMLQEASEIYFAQLQAEKMMK